MTDRLSAILDELVNAVAVVVIGVMAVQGAATTEAVGAIASIALGRSYLKSRR